MRVSISAMLQAAAIDTCFTSQTDTHIYRHSAAQSDHKLSSAFPTDLLLSPDSLVLTNSIRSYTMGFVEKQVYTGVVRSVASEAVPPAASPYLMPMHNMRITVLSYITKAFFITSNGSAESLRII